MSALALTAAAVLALATDPRCGGAQPGSPFAERLVAIGQGESGFDPLVIGVNADPARGLPAAKVLSATPQEAAEKARALLAAGRRIDLGLMQLSDRQLARHRLTLEAAFDACASMRAGAEHYAQDVEAAVVFRLASQRYNTGGFERGQAYALGIEGALRRVRAELADGAAPTAKAAAEPLPPAEQQPPADPFVGHAPARELTFAPSFLSAARPQDGTRPAVPAVPASPLAAPAQARREPASFRSANR